MRLSDCNVIEWVEYDRSEIPALPRLTVRHGYEKTSWKGRSSPPCPCLEHHSATWGREGSFARLDEEEQTSVSLQRHSGAGEPGRTSVAARRRLDLDRTNLRFRVSATFTSALHVKSSQAPKVSTVVALRCGSALLANLEERPVDVVTSGGAVALDARLAVAQGLVGF